MQYQKLKNNVLFIAATHGNENIGVRVLDEISRNNKSVNWLIANKRAYEKNIRFIKNDMNRIAPGNVKSKDYELKRVAQIIKKSRSYDCTIDLHGTDAKTGVFIIITNLTPQNIYLAYSLPVRKIVVWAPKRPKKLGPITKFVICGVEVECGPKDSDEVYKQLLDIIYNIITKGLSYNKKDKEIYIVYDKLNKRDLFKKTLPSLNEFEKVKIDSEVFYPLLVNRYPEILCYKMKKIKLNEFLSY